MAGNDVMVLLRQLSEIQLLAYEQASDKPRITFLLPRQDANRLPLNVARLNERRDLAVSKMEAMINFAQQTLRCRMQVVLEYFDEITYDECGMCDVCMEKKKKNNHESFRDFEQQVLRLVSQKPMSVDDLETSVNPHDHHLFIEVIREMVDRGVIRYDEYWILRRA